MHFLFIKIIDIKYKKDIFLALESVEINKASYMEGYNLDKVLTDELPIFKGLFGLEENESKKVVIITALVKQKTQIQDFLEILKESGLDLENKEILRLMTWPLDMVFAPNLEEK
ncbi:MAG: hypothetical protein ACQERZ_08630 [Fusobacteriota bacterium]